jgi:hypothetical protein
VKHIKALIEGWVDFHRDAHGQVSLTKAMLDQALEVIAADEAQAMPADVRELPADVRKAFERLRKNRHDMDAFYLVFPWFDATFPKPRSQAEKDADALDIVAAGGQLDPAYLRQIAQRLRSAK